MAEAVYLGADAAHLTAAPPPSRMTVELTRTGALYRSVNGTGIVPGGRNRVRRVRLEWADLLPEEAEAVLSAVSGEGFCMKYPDPLENGFRTAGFVPAGIEAQVLRAEEGQTVLGKLAVSAEEV